MSAFQLHFAMTSFISSILCLHLITPPPQVFVVKNSKSSQYSEMSTSSSTIELIPQFETMPPGGNWGKLAPLFQVKVSGL